ncbi:hypothetical protein ABPG77_005698 [Micractinium sp. CCAP 211/92]
MDGLLGLADELLLKILHAAGAPAVGRAATLCRRLRHAQQQLAALPAFASAAVLDSGKEVGECVRGAVTEALAAMPAAVDVCLLFVARGARGRARGADPLAGLVPLCQELLPPGTPVVGCCGRGLFGVQGGAPVELDPSEAGRRGASVLLCRLPDAQLRTFAAQDAPAGGWASAEAVRSWLGLGPGDAPPTSCLLFTQPSVGEAVHDCVAGVGAALPDMLLTGGISSGAGELFCSQPPPQQPEAQGEAAAVDGSGVAGRQGSAAPQRPCYVGLLVWRQGWDDAPGGGAAGSRKRTMRCAGLTVHGLEGVEPLLTQLEVTRNLGVLQHVNDDTGQLIEEVEMLGLSGAQTVQGGDAAVLLRRLARGSAELGLWAAPCTDPGSLRAAVCADEPVVKLQLYGEGDLVMATASDTEALEAVLDRSRQPGHVLCAQPLGHTAESVCRELTAALGKLTAALPPRHALLPTHNCGLVVVSCTAKGRQMFEAVGVEAEAIHAASRGLPLAGVYCDGEIGPIAQLDSQQKRCAVQGFSTILTALAGMP